MLVIMACGGGLLNAINYFIIIFFYFKVNIENGYRSLKFFGMMDIMLFHYKNVHLGLPDVTFVIHTLLKSNAPSVGAIVVLLVFTFMAGMDDPW